MTIGRVLDCDRCGETERIETSEPNCPIAYPERWAIITLQLELSKDGLCEKKHVCPRCAIGLLQFMDGFGISYEVKACRKAKEGEK